MTTLPQALRCAKLIQIVESACLKNCQDTLVAEVEKAGVKFLNTLYVSQMANFLSAHMGQEVMFGFIGFDTTTKDLVVVLRCTETFLEAVHDIAFVPIPNSMKGAEFTLVGSGFLRLFQSLKFSTRNGGSFYPNVKERIEQYACFPEKRNVVICGHSLGGAIATLLALDVALNTLVREPEVYTFGSPRVGDVFFARKFNQKVTNSLRIVTGYDPVQTVPILPSYWHVDTAKALDLNWKDLKLSVMVWHHMSTYLHALSKIIPGIDVIPLPPESLPTVTVWDKLKEKVTKWWKGV